jgi:hypothetical protein
MFDYHVLVAAFSEQLSKLAVVKLQSNVVKTIVRSIPARTLEVNDALPQRAQSCRSAGKHVKGGDQTPFLHPSFRDIVQDVLDLFLRGNVLIDPKALTVLDRNRNGFVAARGSEGRFALGYCRTTAIKYVLTSSCSSPLGLPILT